MNFAFQMFFIVMWVSGMNYHRNTDLHQKKLTQFETYISNISFDHQFKKVMPNIYLRYLRWIRKDFPPTLFDIVTKSYG